MRLIFISDLHLTGPNDPYYEPFLHLLQSQVQPSDILVLGGDLFDLWVGGHHFFKTRYHRFLTCLKALNKQGTDIHYLEGNHDFHLADSFPQNVVTLHSESVTFDLKGYRVFCAHGDTADPNDRGYRLLRTLFRSSVIKVGVRCLPGSWVHALGDKLSQLSVSRRKAPPAHSIPSVALQHYAQKRFEWGDDVVLLGHTHCSDQLEVQLKERTCYYANIGYPRIDQSYLIYQPHQILRQPFPLNTGSLG